MWIRAKGTAGKEWDPSAWGPGTGKQDSERGRENPFSVGSVW